ncbi:MAG: hypothetical protein ACE5GJ_03660 [Gemmatimonadota bacterium]
MTRLKRIIAEAHRRSLWQVLGIYLALSWGVLQVVDLMTEAAGLPSWTPSFAFILLLIGLPITVGTAFVQEGMPSLKRPYRDLMDPNLLEGLTPEEVEVNPAAHPLAEAGVLTWRNAMLGGVGAAALLVAAVAAYLAMWAMGIGPVGSLVAQGVLEAADPVILADFTDRTEGEDLGAALTEAFRVDLLQSKLLALVDNSVLDEGLRRMGRDPGDALTPAVAEELAHREGVKAVIEGEVSPVGSGFLLSAAIVLAETGGTVAAFRENAAGEDELLAAMDRLSLRVREKAGESLRDIRAGQPLERVTTASLEALRLYTRSEQAFNAGNPAETISLLEHAVALDSTFAMAWRRMAAVLSNTGLDRSREVEAATRAFRNRDRLTEMERYLADAFYYSNVKGDRAATIRAYEAALRVDPDSRQALNNLANEYQAVEQLDRAAEFYTRAINGPGKSNTAFMNLIRNRMAVDDTAAVEATLAAYARAYPDDAQLDETRFWVQMFLGGLSAAEATARRMATDPGMDPFLRAESFHRMAFVSLRRGDMGEMRDRFLEAERLAAAVGAAYAFYRRLWTSYMEVELGDRSFGAAHLGEAIRDGAMARLPPLGRNHWFAAIVLAYAYDTAATDAVARDYRESVPAEAQDPETLGRLALSEAFVRVRDGDAGDFGRRLAELRAVAGCRNCYILEEAAAAWRSGDRPRARALYERMANDVSEPFSEIRQVMKHMARRRLVALSPA